MRLWPESKVDRLERQVIELRALTTTLAQGGEWLQDSWGGQKTYSGERVSVTNGFGLGSVFAAVSIIAETIGMLPLKVYRKQLDGTRQEADQHRSWRMLHDKPNPVTIAHRFWSTVTTHLLLWGNAYLEKERDPFTGEVVSLWIVDPAIITVEWNGREKRFVHEGPPKRVWTEETMLHLTGLSLNGITGVSPISTCRNAFGTAMSRDKFEGGFYQRGAKFPGVIEHPGRLGEQGIKNLAGGFAAIHHGTEQMHKTPVLEEGAAFKSTQMPLEDMQFVESKQLSRSEVATIFRLPPAYLAASTGDSLTYATIESNQIQFTQMAILPWTNVIAKGLSQDPEILPQHVMYAEFVIEGLLQADKKSQAEYWEKLHGMNVVSESYIAERENLPKPPPKPKTPAPLLVPQNGGEPSEPAPIIGNNGA